MIVYMYAYVIVIVIFNWWSPFINKNINQLKIIKLMCTCYVYTYVLFSVVCVLHTITMKGVKVVHDNY